MKNSHLRMSLLGLALAAFTTALGACSGDGGANPEPPTLTTSGSGGGSSSSTTGVGGSGGGTGGAPPNCDGPEGCYDCPPKTNEQLLNACTDAQCSKFDNKTRLPLYNNGNLPPVP